MVGAQRGWEQDQRKMFDAKLYQGGGYVTKVLVCLSVW